MTGSNLRTGVRRSSTKLLWRPTGGARRMTVSLFFSTLLLEFRKSSRIVGREGGFLGVQVLELTARSNSGQTALPNIRERTPNHFCTTTEDATDSSSWIRTLGPGIWCAQRFSLQQVPGLSQLGKAKDVNTSPSAQVDPTPLPLRILFGRAHEGLCECRVGLSVGGVNNSHGSVSTPAATTILRPFRSWVFLFFKK